MLRARPVEEKAALARDLEARLMPLLSEGRIKPVIHEVLPLDQAARAHALLAANENFGKVILEVYPDRQEQ